MDLKEGLPFYNVLISCWDVVKPLQVTADMFRRNEEWQQCKFIQNWG